MEKELALLQQQLKAVNQSVGGLAMALALVLTPEQRTQLANNLAALAKNAEAQGNAMLESAFIDLHNVVR